MVIAKEITMKIKLITRNRKVNSVKTSYLYIQYLDENNKIKKKSLGLIDNKDNRKKAEKILLPKLEEELRSEKFFKKNYVPTVDEYFEISIKLHKSERCARTEKMILKGYEYHIKQVFGKKRLDEIKYSHIATWQQDCLLKLAPKSVLRVRSILSVLFNDAIKDEILSVSPVAICKPPTKERLTPAKPFTKKEVFEIIDSMPEKIKAFYAIGFFSGMRVGEIIALKTSDIDLKNRIIKVTKSKMKGIVGKTKNKSSIRDVEIIDALYPILQNHLKHYTMNGDMFITKDNVPYTNYETLKKVYWEPVLRKLNIQYRNQYQMRHTFASLMISNGENILWVSKTLGHADSNTTLAYYAKYIKDTTRRNGSFFS